MLTVGERHRLRLTSEIVARIPWLAKATGPVTVSAIVDQDGGIRLVAPESAQHRRHEEIAKRVSETAAEDDEISKTMLALARHTANAVSLTFSKEQNRTSVVLPRELRAQGAPSEDENAVIFVFGRHVEIWRADAWAMHLRNIDAKHDDLVDGVWDDLGVEAET